MNEHSHKLMQIKITLMKDVDEPAVAYFAMNNLALSVMNIIYLRFPVEH